MNTANQTAKIRKKITPYMYLMPTIVLMVILLVVPICMVIKFSMLDEAITSKAPSFVGIKNYVKVLTDKNFWNAAKNTMFFVLVSIVAHMVIGMVFAMVLNTRYLSSTTKGLCRVIFALPWMFTASVIAILWRLMMNPSGIINYLIVTLHLSPEGVDWLASRSVALIAVTIINIWSGYPFYMISMLAGLQGISTDMYEASALDGANGIRTFIHITLPSLKPILISLIMLDFVWTLQQFALIWMTTGGGPVGSTETIATYIYKQAFSKYKYSIASTAAVLLLIICIIIGIFYVRHQRSEE